MRPNVDTGQLGERWRRFDLLLACGFIAFVFTSLLFDSQPALGITPRADGPLLVRLNHLFASRVDPILLDPPLYFRLMCGISAFVYGPFYIVLAYALIRRRAWIRVPALVYASTILYSLVVITGEALFGPVKPLHWPFFLLAYTPYLIFPGLLFWRMLQAEERS